MLTFPLSLFFFSHLSIRYSTIRSAITENSNCRAFQNFSSVYAVTSFFQCIFSSLYTVWELNWIDHLLSLPSPLSSLLHISATEYHLHLPFSFPVTFTDRELFPLQHRLSRERTCYVHLRKSISIHLPINWNHAHIISSPLNCFFFSFLSLSPFSEPPPLLPSSSFLHLYVFAFIQCFPFFLSSRLQ